MDSALPHPISSQRLADQLQTLSVLAESLTIRVLELEERLLHQERQLQPHDEAAHQDLELRLSDTDQRLLRIESLLQGLDRPASARHLQEVPRPVLQQGLEAAELAASEADPFPEDGEQAFMDELTA